MTTKTSRPWYRSGSTWVAGAFVAAAALVAWFGAGQSALTAPTGEPLTMAASAKPAVAKAAAANPLSIGSLPTRVVISSAGIDTPIVEVGIIDDNGRPAWETAWHAAGHHLDSALPGQPGNLVLTGHVSVADKRNAPVFSKLDAVRAGDVVDVYSGDTVYHYRVDDISVVAPDNIRVLRSDQSSTVTLITCTRDLKHRLVVTGTLA